MAYRHFLHRDLHFQTEIYGQYYEDRYFVLYKTGKAIVKAGARSDGNSFKLPLFDWDLIGPFDGTLQNDGLVKTARPFFLHDRLSIARLKLGLTRVQTAHEYKREMLKTNFSLRHIYIKGLYAYARSQDAIDKLKKLIKGNDDAVTSRFK